VAVCCEPLRVGVAGLGVVAQVVHLPLLARRRDLFRLSALCDVSRTVRDQVGQRYGVAQPRRYPSLDAMLTGGELDAVLLLTSGSHGPQARAILDAGLAVLCEKPLAYTVAEADDLQAAGPGGTGHRLLLGYMKQYDPAVQHMLELLPPVESIRTITVTVLHPSSAAQLAFAGTFAPPPDVDAAVLAELREAEGSALQRALGPVPPEVCTLYSDVVLGSVVHDLSLIRMVAGSPVSMDGVDVWPRDGRPGSLTACGRLASGARFGVGWHYLPDYPAYRETLSVHHETGSFELVFPAPYLLHAPTELTVVDAVGHHERRSVHRSVVEAFEQELVAFHAMVTRGLPPLSSVAQGRADIITGQQILRRFAEQTGLVIGGEAARA